MIASCGEDLERYVVLNTNGVNDVFSQLIPKVTPNGVTDPVLNGERLNQMRQLVAITSAPNDNFVAEIQLFLAFGTLS